MVGNSVERAFSELEKPDALSKKRGREIRPVFLSTSEVAALIGVKVRTVRRLIEKGSLPAARIGRERRIFEDDLRMFLARACLPGKKG